MKNLIIVESPTKARTISRFLGKNYRLVSTMGHIWDLPEKRLGIKIKTNDLPRRQVGQRPKYQFVPQYVLVPGKEAVVKELKKAAAQAEKIYLATDPDREGEAIAWHTMVLLGAGDDSFFAHAEFAPAPAGGVGLTSQFAQKGHLSLQEKSRFSRIVFHEITKSAIEKALQQLGEINMNLVRAQQARRVLDRLVGYKLSPLLWRKIRRGLSAGRVQSVAVRLIVDREREIEAFVPEEYWQIGAWLYPVLPDRLPVSIPDRKRFWARLVRIGRKKAKIRNKTQTEEIVKELKKASYQVIGVEKKLISQEPAPPFTTSTLQQRAAQVLHFSSKRTMRVAQSLYEKGLITYHRTDSVSLAGEAVKKIRHYINSTYGREYLPVQPRVFKTKSKVAQEAHEAIRPTKIKFKIPASSAGRPASSAGKQKTKLKIGRDETRLYQLIWRRAVASQMKKAVWEETRVAVKAWLTPKEKEYFLEAKGKKLQFPGWQIIYQNRNQKLKTKNETELPELKKGDKLRLVEVKAEQKFTQPPSRYSESALIKALEERGIGRPSTYAPIVSTIQERRYVEKIEGRFQPTPLGVTVNDFLVKYFPQIIDYEFTAKMESELDEIAKGQKKWMPVVSDFYQPFQKKLIQVFQKAGRVAIPVEKTKERCPQCQKGEVVIRIGKFGRFLSCSRFPECDYTAPFIPKLEGVSCPECGGEVLVKKTQKGKQFYGCSRWPECSWASWRKPQNSK